MKYHLPHLACLLMAFFLAHIAHADVRINEIMASNGSTIADEDGDFEDWIELVNIGSEAADLSGWGLSDNENNPFKWVFPEGAWIPANEFMLVWASGKDRITPNNSIFPLIDDGSTWRFMQLNHSRPTGSLCLSKNVGWC